MFRYLFPLLRSEVYDHIEQGVVLDIPVSLPNLERAVYVWYQTKHGNPVPWGLNDPMPTGILENKFTKMLLLLETTRAHDLPPKFTGARYGCWAFFTDKDIVTSLCMKTCIQHLKRLKYLKS